MSTINCTASFSIGLLSLGYWQRLQSSHAGQGVPQLQVTSDRQIDTHGCYFSWHPLWLHSRTSLQAMLGINEYVILTWTWIDSIRPYLNMIVVNFDLTNVYVITVIALALLNCIVWCCIAELLLNNDLTLVILFVIPLTAAKLIWNHYVLVSEQLL